MLMSGPRGRLPGVLVLIVVPVVAIALGLAGYAFFRAAPAPSPVAAIDTEILPGVALGGYDAVAYFAQGRPVVGDSAITLEHAGATWRFASLANRAAFLAAPERFAPQYGGYCAWAVANGGTAKGDPQAWKIVNGKLYLNYDTDIQKQWEQNIPGNIARSEANWPKLRKP